MTWMDRMSALLARKSSRAGAAVAAVGLAPARWTPRRYDRLAEEGYRKNVVAYRCVREVARACASVPWLLYKSAQELDTHPLLDLLRRDPDVRPRERCRLCLRHRIPTRALALRGRPDCNRPRHVHGVPAKHAAEIDHDQIAVGQPPVAGAMMWQGRVGSSGDDGIKRRLVKPLLPQLPLDEGRQLALRNSR